MPWPPRRSAGAVTPRVGQDKRRKCQSRAGTAGRLPLVPAAAGRRPSARWEPRLLNQARTPTLAGRSLSLDEVEEIDRLPEWLAAETPPEQCAIGGCQRHPERLTTEAGDKEEVIRCSAFLGVHRSNREGFFQNIKGFSERAQNLVFGLRPSRGRGFE
jgi:hypothetical protein